ncbi:MAG: 50S ribosomal protein L10, partial [Patescibacteria group bacterium]
KSCRGYMTDKKVQTVASLKDQISKAKSVVLADYRGLTHKQAEELHKVLKKVEGEFTVVKNTLLKIAAKQSGDERLSKNTVAGPVAALFAYADEFAPLRELVKFASALGGPAIKLAYINGIEYSADQAMTIAKLPSLDGLRSQFVYTLNANIQKLVYVLGVIKDAR